MSSPDGELEFKERMDSKTGVNFSKSKSWYLDMLDGFDHNLRVGRVMGMGSDDGMVGGEEG